MIVEFHMAAQAELESAAAYYRSISDDLGEAFREEAGRAVQRIAERPDAWQPLGNGLRRYILKRFPYGMVFRVHDGQIKVYAVMHLKRRPEYWRKRLRPAAT